MQLHLQAVSSRTARTSSFDACHNQKTILFTGSTSASNHFNPLHETSLGVLPRLGVPSCGTSIGRAPRNSPAAPRSPRGRGSGAAVRGSGVKAQQGAGDSWGSIAGRNWQECGSSRFITSKRLCVGTRFSELDAELNACFSACFGLG